MSDVDTEPITRQVVAQAQAISQLRHDLDQLANELTDAYANVLSRINEADRGQPATGSTGSPWSWRSIGPQTREQLWKELHDWVHWLRARYPLAKKIPRCWDQHPETIEELTALWLAWQAAYEDGEASLTTAVEWHDRWLPGFLHRTEHGAFSLDCSVNHHDRPPGLYSRLDQTQSNHGGVGPN